VRSGLEIMIQQSVLELRTVGLCVGEHILCAYETSMFADPDITL
jgi:hypothetical protein